MKVILQQDIPNLGEAGDIVKVKDGYARNYLIPRNLVLRANAANRRQKAHYDRLIKFKKDRRQKTATEMAEKFGAIVCEFRRRVGDVGKLYGSVTALDVASKLAELGYSVDKRKVQLADPIKNLGEYDVTVKLAEGVEANVKVRVMDLNGNLSHDSKEAKESELKTAESTSEGVADTDQELVIEDISSENE